MFFRFDAATASVITMTLVLCKLGLPSLRSLSAPEAAQPRALDDMHEGGSERALLAVGGVLAAAVVGFVVRRKPCRRSAGARGDAQLDVELMQTSMKPSGSVCSATTSCGTTGVDTPPEDASTVAGDLMSYLSSPCTRFEGSPTTPQTQASFRIAVGDEVMLKESGGSLGRVECLQNGYAKTEGSAQWRPAVDLEVAPPPQVSLTAGVVMLYKNIVGAGMLSLPFALASAGEVGALMLVGTGILSGLAFWLLGYLCHFTGADSFAGLWSKAVGRNSLWVVNACVVINGIGACTAYLLLIADFLTTHAADVTTSRAAHLAWVALLILPLAWKRKLTGLTFSSSVGVASMLYVVGLVVFHPAGDADAPSPEPLPAPSGKSMAKMFALSVLTFLAHYNAPKLYSELGYKAFTKTVVIAYSLVICTCLAIGLAGVRRFGTAVAGNVLASFPHTDPWAAFGSAAVTLTLFVSYPLVFSSTRDTIDTILPVREELWRARVAGLVLLTAFFGATFDDIAFVSALKGATVGMALSLGFPALFALRLPVTAATRAMAWVMLVASFAGVSCALTAIFT